MQPLLGGVKGGTSINVYGDGFDLAALELSCDMKGIVRPARVVNASLAQCVSPAHESGNSTLYIRTHRDVVANFEYVYVNEPRIIAIVPSRGPATGGTNVRIFGSGFQSQNHLDCCFDGISSNATFVSSEEIICETPQAHNRNGEIVAVSVGCTHDANTIAFEYMKTQIVTEIYPSYGPNAGGTVVTVTGTNFGAQPWCRFGTRYSRASFLSLSSLSCLSPSLEDASMTVPVSVVDEYTAELFESAPHTFTYQATAIVTRVYPLRSVATGGTKISVHGMYFHVSSCVYLFFISFAG